MRANGLIVKKKRYTPLMTDSEHDNPVIPNPGLGLDLNGPDRGWAAVSRISSYEKSPPFRQSSSKRIPDHAWGGRWASSLLRSGKATYCFECRDFPCERLQKLDQKYRANFRSSFIENLKSIKKDGPEKFLRAQRRKWKCPKCGDVVCCHNGVCYSCQLATLGKKLHQYRWE